MRRLGKKHSQKVACLLIRAGRLERHCTTCLRGPSLEPAQVQCRLQQQKSQAISRSVSLHVFTGSLTELLRGEREGRRDALGCLVAALAAGGRAGGVRALSFEQTISSAYWSWREVSEFQDPNSVALVAYTPSLELQDAKLQSET